MIEALVNTYTENPVPTPALPIPDIARPMMSVFELGARPDNKDPIWKVATAPKKIHFGVNSLYTLPNVGRNVHDVSRLGAF